MRPKFKLRIVSTYQRHRSNAHDALIRQNIKAKEQQLKNAVQFCVANNCRGYAALKTLKFPLIKDARTVNKRLDGLITTGHEKYYQSILTEEEEASLVRHIKNKNRFV